LNKSILTVDASISLREMMVFSLEGAGYDVVQAVDGVDALERANGRQFDIVLTAQHMPNMDGITLIRNLRRLDGYQDIPILMITSESDEELKERGFAAGANEWMLKPVTPKSLIEAVKHALQA